VNERKSVLAARFLAVRSAKGAYGFVMASNYKPSLQAAEVMVDGCNSFYVVREREPIEQLLRVNTC